MVPISNNPDPLGLALQARARAKRTLYNQQHPGQMAGPLPDQQWEGYFQALDEAGVKKFNYADDPGNDLSRDQVQEGIDNNVSNQALQGLLNSRSQQLGTPIDRKRR